VATAPALELLLDVGIDTIHAHDVGLANRMRAALDLPPSNSAIVSAPLPGARERLDAAGIIAAERGGRLRCSWHLYNTAADVDALLDVVLD
jgi:selenocysteine lyase/cysteine desulfurase